MTAVLVCRISWMHKYEGLTNDSIVPAGRYVRENRWGGECWNFKAHRGHMYGYARVNSSHDPTPVIERLTDRQGANCEHDVTVVWVAHKGSISNNCVVGWFENSKVFSDFKNRKDKRTLVADARRAGIETDDDQEEFQYFVRCRKEDARLLADSERRFPVPIAKGWMGTQSLLFYPDKGVEHEEFRIRLLDYIAACANSKPISSGSYSPSVEPLGEPLTVEGKQALVTHVQRERDASLIRQAKNAFKVKHDRLFCEACGFDFHKKYGSLGDDFIEAHHIRPLAKGGPRNTSPHDLLMLCANCHRMVHRWMNREGRSLTRDESKQVGTRSGD